MPRPVRPILAAAAACLLLSGCASAEDETIRLGVAEVALAALGHALHI